MRNILYIAIIVLLSGCAKVTQDGQACANPPVAGAIADTIVSLSEDLDLTTTTSSGATIRWTLPNGTSTTASHLQINFYDTAKYGTYTYVAVNGVCDGATQTFHVWPNHPGSPTCTGGAGNNNQLQVSDGSHYDLSGVAASGYGTYCSTSREAYTIATNNNARISFNSNNTLLPGGYYNVDSTCPYYGDRVYAYIQDIYAGRSYYSIDGRIYCNTINGQKYLTLCSTTFRRSSDGAVTTITGTVAIP